MTDHLLVAIIMFHVALILLHIGIAGFAYVVYWKLGCPSLGWCLPMGFLLLIARRVTSLKAATALHALGYVPTTVNWLDMAILPGLISLFLALGVWSLYWGCQIHQRQIATLSGHLKSLETLSDQHEKGLG